MWSVVSRLLPWVAIATACGEPAARVQLVPVNPGTCGKLSTDIYTGIRVIAYTSTGESRKANGTNIADFPDIADFPADTEQLGVEVLIGGGALGAVGKTGPIDFANLRDGATLPIVMAPLDGFCPVGEMSEPRVAPLVARAGNGVLVVGGSVAGPPNGTADYYDPATATFTPVALPALDGTALLGAALGPLPDGRVVLTGGSRGVFSVFDPQTRAFSGPYLLAGTRIYPSVIGIDATHALVTGGCNSTNLMCDDMATALHSTLDYAIEGDGKPVEPAVAKPSLPAGSKRYGAQLLDLGIESDGGRWFALGGGFGDAGAVDRIPVDGVIAKSATGVGAQIGLLDGGAVITAFDPDGAAQTGIAAVVSPDDGATSAIAPAPRLDGGRLALLEDGSVIAIGGDVMGQVARYSPTTNTWSQTVPSEFPPGGNADAPGPLAAPALIGLPDGTVLVLGGRTPTASAWIYRPSLVGPQTAQITAFPGNADIVLTAPLPSTVDRNQGHFKLSALDDSLAARALVGGPRMVTGSISASVVIDGGVALIAQQVSVGRLLVGELRGGAHAHIDRIDHGVRTTLCAGATVNAFDAGRRTIKLEVRNGAATLTLDDLAVASCDLSGDPEASDRGAWGLAPAGKDATVDVVTITVER
jgi:hypothetical protein